MKYAKYIPFIFLGAVSCGCLSSVEDSPDLISCHDTENEYYCAQGSLCCKGACVQVSDENCGVCGNSCKENESCQASADGSYQCVCGSTGQACSLTCCPSGCVELSSSVSNCGVCGTACGSDKICNNGLCQCSSGLAQCGNDCVDFTSDSKHCGSCNNTCPDASNASLNLSDSYCKSGTCMIVCKNGYSDIDGLIGNGCERNACGNGNVDAGESCDGTNFNGATCKSVMGSAYSGTLLCNLDCTYNVSGCVKSTCGNGMIDSDEVCDGDNLNGRTCENVRGPGSVGTPVCNASCTEFEFGTCTDPMGATSGCTLNDARCENNAYQVCTISGWQTKNTCVGATSICSTEKKACIECLSDSNCSATKPHCNTGTGSCVVCTTDSHCGSGKKCIENVCQTSTQAPTGYSTIEIINKGFDVPDANNANPSVVGDFAVKAKAGTGENNGISVGYWSTSTDWDFRTRYVKYQLSNTAVSALNGKSGVGITFRYARNNDKGPSKLAVAFFNGEKQLNAEPCIININKTSLDVSEMCTADISSLSSTFTAASDLHVRFYGYAAGSDAAGTLKLYPAITIYGK